MTDFKQWEGFEGRIWKEEVNTRDFIQKNYTPYDGDESFLAGPTDATNHSLLVASVGPARKLSSPS